MTPHDETAGLVPERYPTGQQGQKNGAWLVAASAFAFGLLTGLFLKGAAKRIYDLARATRSHRDYERTVTYGQNLPDSLGRREPQPEQPRYGGTGALGVPPTTAGVRPSGK